MRFGDHRSNRIDPKLLEACYPDHESRYSFARRYVRGKTVLDVGCGFGYGTASLAESALSATGVDPYEPAIQYARNRYPGCRFIVGDVESIDASRNSFDVVVSMEVIEHVQAPETFLDHIRGILAPHGTIVISTPNSLVTSPDGTPSDPTHLREYTPDEFRHILAAAGFTSVTLFGLHLGEIVWQRHGTRATLGRIDRIGIRRLVPARAKATLIRVLTRTGRPEEPPARISSDIEGAHSQIAVATLT